MKNKTLKDWLVVTAIAMLIVGAFLAPAYVVRQTHADAERIASLIEENAVERLEQMILVNTFTISCLLAIPPEDRTNEKLQNCIEAGFQQAPDIESPAGL